MREPCSARTEATAREPGGMATGFDASVATASLPVVLATTATPSAVPGLNSVSFGGKIDQVDPGVAPKVTPFTSTNSLLPLPCTVAQVSRGTVKFVSPALSSGRPRSG